jgi:hypothetical protein
MTNMQSFLITYKPATENPKSGWPIKEVQRLVKICHKQGWAEEDWRFRSLKKVSLGDRIFLLLQGKCGPAIIGFGNVVGFPSNHDNVPRIRVRFESIVDPTIEVMASKEELLRIEGASNKWRTQSSGIPLPESVASNLEILILGTTWCGQDTDNYLMEAPEGRLLIRKHLSRERNRDLVESKRRQALDKYGVLRCEVCGFDFAAHYGSRGFGFIECHHTKPVATLAVGDVTHIDDLALVCANCHRIIHRSRPWISVEELKDAIRQMSQSV